MAERRGLNARSLARAGSTLGAPTFLIHISSTTSAGTSNTDSFYSSDAPFKFRILDAWLVLTEAGASDSEDFKLSDGTTDITDTLDVSSGADKSINRWTTIDDSVYEISQGGSLDLVKTATTAVISAEVYILCARI